MSKPVTTSATFVCIPETSTSTAAISSVAMSVAGPTTSPLPPVSSQAQTLIDELSTAILYAALLSNARDEAKLCSIIDPSNLAKISGVAINGTAVRQEICALAAIEVGIPSSTSFAVGVNQRGLSYLATALYAVQVAGDYAGGPSLPTLCSEIEATLIDNLFINNINGVGTAVKQYVCSAASANATSISPPHSTNSTTPACSSPTGYANTVVPAPDALALSTFRVAPAFTSKHTLFITTDLNTAQSEAAVATSCLKQCAAYQHNATSGPCLSFDINLGKPIPSPPAGQDSLPRWYCSGYNAPLSPADYVAVNVPGSFLHSLGVNRVCEGTYRAY